MVSQQWVVIAICFFFPLTAQLPKEICLVFLSYYTNFGHVMNTKEAYIIDNKMHIYIYVMPPL